MRGGTTDGDKEQGGDRFTTTSRNEGKRGLLRKAADKNYPDLPKRIREHLP